PVEPFVEGKPGKHVRAAIDEARRRGLDPDVGPFATTVEGEAADVVDALAAITGAAIEAGATRVAVSLARTDAKPDRAGGRPGPRMLDRLIAEVERQLGGR